MNKILRGILYFLIFYSILWIQLYYSLDEIDQITLKMFVGESVFGKGIVNCDIGSNFSSGDRLTYSFIKIMLQVMLLPFGNQDKYDDCLKGMLISGVYFNRLNIKSSQFCDKIYWYDIFTKYKIKTPDIYIHIDETGKQNQRKQINNNETYIAKPVKGTFGMGMNIMKGDKLKDFNYKNYIVQKLLIDCRLPKKDTRCFRYVTLYNGQKIVLIERIKKNSQVSSHPDITNICYYNNCHNLTAAENKEMMHITNQLAELHRNEYSKVFSIGWDIMINCDGNNIEMYALEGNVFHHTYIFELTEGNKQFVKNYKREGLKFYKMHNLT